MSIANNFPAIAPSLSLDFASVKKLDPRVTFARASGARFYDGVTVAKAEENLLLRSQEFDNTTAWAVIAGVSITANSTTAPDGTSTAETLLGDGTSSIKRVSQSVTPGGPCVFSCFVKKNTNDFVQFYFSGDNTSFANFNVSTGVVGTTGGTVTSSIVDVGNGWYRCIAVNTSTAVTAVAINLVDSSSAGRAQTTTLSTSVFLWGAQLEQRSSVTAYTPTTTQPITNYIPVLQTAANNVARFDHNPVTGESLGLLVEELRTNLLLRSEQFDDAAWTKANSTITANTIVAPDGTLTSDKLIEDTTNNQHRINQTILTVTNQAYTFSVYVKAGETPTFAIQIVATGSSATTSTIGFIITNGVIAWDNSLNGLASAVSVIPAGNGWYRCVVVYTLNGTVTSHQNRIFPRSSNIYTGDGYSGIYIWGAQLEAGEFPTSYIKTEASQVTRSADAASMTGANFSSWYSQGEGTLYAEARGNVPASNEAGIFRINSNTSSNEIRIRYVNNLIAGQIQSASGETFNQAASAVSSVFYKSALTYQTDNSAFCVNAGSVTTDTSVVVPSAVNQAMFGTSSTGTSAFLNGTIRKIAFYPRRLTNAQLQALTS